MSSRAKISSFVASLPTTSSTATSTALALGRSWIFAAQSGGSGTVHPTSGDTYSLSYTAGGINFTATGHF